MTLNETQLREFIESKLGIDTTDIGSDAPLFSNGTLDSFSMVDLVLFLEESGGFRMTPGEVNLDHLDSIERILAFTVSKASCGTVAPGAPG